MKNLNLWRLGGLIAELTPLSRVPLRWLYHLLALKSPKFSRSDIDLDLVERPRELERRLIEFADW